MSHQVKRNVVVFEGRGAWNIVKYEDRIHIDSPVQNIVQAALISTRLLEKNEQVIMFPVIDRLVSTREYNFPRTFANRHGQERIDRKERFKEWMRNIPIEVRPKDQEFRNEISKLLVSHQEERFIRFRSAQKEQAEESYRKMISDLEKKSGAMISIDPPGLDMGIFDTESTIYLINLTLDGGIVSKRARENLNIIPLVVPTETFNRELILEIASRLVTTNQMAKSLGRFLDAMFGNLLRKEEKGKFPKSSIPIFIDVNGYFNSPTKLELKSEKLRITPFSREYGEVDTPIEYNDKSLELILRSSKRISIKYPMVILDYIFSILNRLTSRNQLSFQQQREYVLNSFTKVINDSIRMEIFIKELVDRMNIDRVERFIFVEGDYGGVNVMTGGIVDEVFKILSQALGAQYIRIISIERESFEPYLRKLSYREIIDKLKLIDSKENHYSLYVERDGSYVRSRVRELF
ncbi:MAG: hypothetical protein NZ908_01505 [Candidatus Micrarchaeota archaeon]|nr:hypothetical protein [Candidatus Micrarchaeota archaeon]